MSSVYFVDAHSFGAFITILKWRSALGLLRNVVCQACLRYRDLIAKVHAVASGRPSAIHSFDACNGHGIDAALIRSWYQPLMCCATLQEPLSGTGRQFFTHGYHSSL
jgi:hypothetical protein